MKKIGIETVVNDEHKIAAYHCFDEKIKPVDVFVYDHKANKKIRLSNDNEPFEIKDISPCGTKVLTINTDYTPRKRKTKIFDIQTQQVLFETTDFFGYEALFTSKPNLIICRADIKSKDDKSFVYDIEKREVVHIMSGKFCLTYAVEDKEHNRYVYPNSKKKGEFIILDLNTLEEKKISIKEPFVIQIVLLLKNGDYIVLNENIDAIRLDSEGKVIWKRKLDFDEFYFAPDCFEFDGEIIFNMYENFRLKVETGEIYELEKKFKPRLDRYFDNTAIEYGFSHTIIDLKTRELTSLDISQFGIEES